MFFSWPLAFVGKFIPVPETPFVNYFSRIFCHKSNRQGTHLDFFCGKSWVGHANYQIKCDCLTPNSFTCLQFAWLIMQRERQRDKKRPELKNVNKTKTKSNLPPLTHTA